MTTPPKKRRGRNTFISQSFLGKIVSIEGRLAVKLNAVMLYDHFLKTHCKIGDDVDLKITNRRPKRTDAQNRYYHVYLHLISLSSGHTHDELHSWVKGRFLTKGITEVFGDKVRKVKSTTELNVSEFIELMMRIEEATNVPAPDPEPFALSLTHEEYKKLKKEQEANYRKMNPKID